MAINAYVGLQGSGKSYEAVSGPVLDAIAQGRRVVTNIDGVNEERVREYLVAHRKADPEKLGCIIHVTNDRVVEPHFFPDEKLPDVESVVRGGDLVAIDESWRSWGTDQKLSYEHMQFFRMHRHYVHPDTLVTCDVILMTQDITGLHRSLRNVVEYTFRMHKHKSLGLTSRYRVEIYEGAKLTSKTRTDQYQKKYDPLIFPLYQSYTGGKGQESTIDSRQNIFSSKFLWVSVILTVVIGISSAYFAWRFFHPPGSDAKPVQSSKSDVKEAKASAQPIQSSPASIRFSDSWRVVGEYASGGERWHVVANGAGRLRVESPSVFHGQGQAVIGDIDGEKVTRWSGVVAEKGSNSSQAGAR